MLLHLFSTTTTTTIATTRNTYAPLLLAAAVATAAAYVSMFDLVVRLLVPYVWEGPGGVFAKSVPYCQPWSEILSLMVIDLILILY